MGIRVFCPNGHRLNLKSFLAGKKGICPHCGMTVHIPSLEQAEELGMVKDRKTVVREAVGVADGRRGSDVLTLDPETSRSDDRNGALRQSRPAPVARSKNGVDHDDAAKRVSRADRPVEVDDGGLDLAARSPSHDASRREAAPVDDRVATRAAETPEVDPIADNPQAVWYVRTPQGGQYGPAAGDIMRKWIAEGRVQPDFWVWREGWTDWKKAAGSVPGLRGAQEPATSVPASAPAAPASPNGHFAGNGTLAAPARASEPAPVREPHGSGDGYASPRATARPRKRGGIHPLAILAVVGLGLVCLALLGVLIALVAGAL